MLMISPALLMVNTDPAGASTVPMTMTINTSATGCTGLSVQLPLVGGVNATVDWGDGTTPQTVTSSNPTHTYSAAGTYTISINGSVGAFGETSPFCQLTGVTSWGNNGTSGEVGLAGLTSLAYAFFGDANLTAVPTTFPTAVTSTDEMFDSATAFNQNISSWNTAAVTDMRYMFAGDSAFNQNISSWNTAAVTDMSIMFYNATAFNQNISSSNTAKVTDMSGMFDGATAFNNDGSPLATANGGWNTAKVTDMDYMFYGATAFNQNISSWNTAAVTYMYWMFYGASAFNNDGSPLATATNGWNTAAVTDMSVMFYNATAFNQSLGTWVITGVTSMNSMFSSTPLSIANYDATLIGWASQRVQSGVALGASGLIYDSSATASRTTLTTTDSWTITGDSLSSSSTAPTISGATITGTPSVGETLSAVAATVTGSPTPTPTYQWSSGAGPITGATGSTYVVSAGDVGHTLTVTITETNSAGSASATSAATATVTVTAIVTPPPIVHPKPVLQLSPMVLYYSSNSWALSSTSKHLLNVLAHEIEAHHLTTVTIDGYASSPGTKNDNAVVATNRARVGASYLKGLLASLHVRRVTFRVTGFGASGFAAKPYDSPINRRTTIVAR
jgi:surface protein